MGETVTLDFRFISTPVRVCRELACERIRQGYSQRDLAEVLRTKQSWVSDLEAGAVDPRLSGLMKWASSLGFRLALVQVEDSPEYAITDEEREAMARASGGWS